MKTPPKTIRRLVICFLLPLVSILTGHGAEITLNVTLDGGDVVKVRYVGQTITTSRIMSLVRAADRSLVTTNPSIAANGTMQTGDRIAITNNLMVWFDCTRQANYWSGGGGMLRGVWRLHLDTSNNLNFKYIANSDGWAPNNLFPGQAFDRPQPDGTHNGHGDAWQILCVKQLGSDPENTYRATSTETTTILDDGTYLSADGALSYHFRGQLTTGKGTADSGWDANIGVSASQPARINYHAIYKVYNNKRGSNGYRIDATFTVDVANGSLFYATDSIKSLVFSLGMSRTTISESIRLDWLKPIAQDMVRGSWTKKSNGDWENLNSDITPIGQSRFVPEPSGTAEEKYILGNVFMNSGEVFDTKFYGADDSSFGTRLRMRMLSSLNSTGFPIFDIGVYYQYIYDLPNYNFVQDLKIGDNNQGGIIGIMQKGWTVTCTNQMFFDYDFR